MSESDLDCVDEYTSLMDGHVAAETRTSSASLATKRKKTDSKVASSIEVQEFLEKTTVLLLLLQSRSKV